MLFRESLALAEDVTDGLMAAMVLHNQSYAALTEGDVAQDRALLCESLERNRRLGYRLETVYCLAGLAGPSWPSARHTVQRNCSAPPAPLTTPPP